MQLSVGMHTQDLASLSPSPLVQPQMSQRRYDQEGKSFNVAASSTDSCQIRIARAHDASILATGGRHSSTITLNGVVDGVAIDLQRLKTLEIDAERALLTVGGGVQFGNVIDPVHEAGFEMRRCNVPQIQNSAAS